MIEQDQLTREETALIRKYRQLTDDEQKTIKKVINALLKYDRQPADTH